MAARCDVCKRTVDAGSLHDLSGLDIPRRAMPKALHVCESCIEVRESRAWSDGDPETSELLEALRDRTEPKRGRYSFLADEDDNVHLLRLREEWVERASSGDIQA